MGDNVGYRGERTSFQDRIERTIVTGIEAFCDVLHAREEDFNAVSYSHTDAFNNPRFIVNIQQLPVFPRVPAVPVRGQIRICINKKLGDDAFEQKLKIKQAQDKIDLWFKQKASLQLSARVVQLINGSVTIQGEMFTSLSEFNFTAFLRQGEY